MLTLEKVRPSTEKYPKGTRLVCYEGYYGFYK
jgi:hypothetical protein